MASGSGSESPGAWSSDPESVRRIYEDIARVCFFAGLDTAETQDLAQDVWLFLIQSGIAIAAVSSPWVRSVARNFVLRHWRTR